METIINKNDLLHAINRIETIVPAREIRPAVANILMEGKDDKIILTTTDFEMNYRNKITAQIIKPGKASLPAKKLSQTLKEMRGEMISITLDKENKVTIKKAGENSKAEVTIIASNIEDFPEIEFPKINQFIQLSASSLLKMIKKIDYAMAEEDARYIFNGLYMNYKDDEFVMVATDGRRLSICKKKEEAKLSLHNGIIIPHKSIREIKKILEGIENINIYYNKEDQKLFLNDHSLYFSTRLIEGQYPDYKQVIPDKNKYTINIEKEEFLKVLRLNAVLAAEPSKQVLLNFKKGELMMSASTPDIGKVHDSISLSEYNGENFNIALNSKYLFDVINNIEAEKIKIELVAENSPMVILDPEFSDFKALIMPMKI